MKTASPSTFLVASLLLACAPPTFAQTAADRGHVKALVISQITPAIPTRLMVSSPAFKDGQDIPFEYTSFRDNLFPGVSWTRGPEGTKSYVVTMQGVLKGGDDEKLGTSVHFLLYNLPPGLAKLPAGLKSAPQGAAFGATVHGFNDVYVGPHTHSATKHAYHLEVFALDTIVASDAKMTLAILQKIMEGHVLASGETIGWAGLDPNSPEAGQSAKAGGGEPKT